MDTSNLEVVALVDCDSFFASCEQLVNPYLLDQPVCVLSNKDGCVVARSKEAKKLGIKMGMPAFQSKKLYPQAHYISGRLGLYREISSRVISILRELCPVIEVYSIDEAFLDLKGLNKTYKMSYPEIAKYIKDTIKRKIGIPVSVGISSTKTLAKLATERAKASTGCYEIDFRDINTELNKTEVSDIWGIGRNTANLLRGFGIRNAYEFVNQNNNFIEKKLGKRGLELKFELTGVCVYPVTDEISLPKSIQQTSSLGRFTSNKQYILDSLHYHTHRSCKRLRKLGMKAHIVGVMLRTKDFKVYYTKNILLKPANWEFEIFKALNKLFSELYNPDIIYRSSGVVLDNLIKEEECQLSLFNPLDNELKQQNLAKTWDKLESKYGKGVITIGTYHNKPVIEKTDELSALQNDLQ